MNDRELGVNSDPDSIRYGQKIISLHSRGIITEAEMTSQLIDTILLSRDLELRNVPECLAIIPPGVQDELRAFMRLGLRSDADWEKVRPIFGGDEESQRLARERIKKNSDILREYSGFPR